ncbi:site-2 protease family protein [Candidatus Daviesbacteria bacterium]|nr:site-2 protease family protein [Candidatus Daviesbacteria bacterium]
MIISILIFIITLLVLVVIHELGHFLMAKRFGIKVEEFGFGIPPRIWGKKIGETLYSINWIPYGGFVKLLGEDEVDGKILKNPRSFAAKSVHQRILVVIGGVVMNLLLAWLIFYVVLFFQNFKIIYPTIEPGIFVGFVENNFPAQQAGIKVGDRILAIDNQKLINLTDGKKFIQEKKGAKIEVKLADIEGQNPRLLTITPKQADNGDYLIGVAFSPIPFKQYLTLGEKLFSGITYSYDLTRVTFMGLGQMFSNLFRGDLQTVSQSVAGPIGIANITSNILSTGWQAILPYLWFIGVLSLTLTIFNVLPIPALDGGRLLFLLIEAAIGKKVKAEVEKLIHTVGFVLLLSLAVLITYSDIKKLLP